MITEDEALQYEIGKMSFAGTLLNFLWMPFIHLIYRKRYRRYKYWMENENIDNN